MLIPSHRHRLDDLAIWRGLEEADLAATPDEARIDRARVEVERFLAAGPAAISVSWGKDSVVVASIALEVDGRVPIVHLSGRPNANPDSEAVRDAFLAAHPHARYEERVFEYRPKECSPHRVGDDTGEARWRREMAVLIAEHGDRYISGIRADESARRRIRCRIHGASTARTCAPISWWNSDHVFAHLAARRLPVHPAYAMLGGGRWPREHVRTDEIGGTGGVQYGRAEWEMEYYGDVLRRVQAHAESMRR